MQTPEADMSGTRADAGDAGDALRLCDGIGLSVRDGRIVIDNPAAEKSTAVAGDAIPILELFANWTTPSAVVDWALGEGEGEGDGDGSGRFNRAIGVLRALLSIDALIARQEDLTGARLPPPGRGWADAMRFLWATRTPRETTFAPPADFNAALAEKALLVRQASAFMEHPDAPYQALSMPRTAALPGDLAFPDVMLRRRTARRYADKAMTEAQLSTLLYFGWGMTTSVPNPLGDVFVRKTSPSGGSLHPVEVYPLVLNVDDVEKGAYHYSVRRHGLERLWQGDPRDWIAQACGDQTWVAEAGVVVLCTAFLPRTAWKYDFSRVARAVMAEIGFSGQSALLTAAWLGLGGFTTIALRDEIFEELIGLDPAREPAFSVIGVGVLEREVSDPSRPRSESAAVEGA